MAMFPRSKSKYVQSSIVEEHEDRSLQCPECGCPKIVFREEDDEINAFLLLGCEVRCWECGHEFSITENCWKLVE